MPRRVTLPGADELFRATGSPAAATVTPLVPSADRTASRSTGASTGERPTSGRERHEEKITVYVSPRELVELEQARLTLRAEYGVRSDRGRIVREALALALADLEAQGADSPLVRRLTDS
jgi:hypothetical protein